MSRHLFPIIILLVYCEFMVIVTDFDSMLACNTNPLLLCQVSFVSLGRLTMLSHLFSIITLVVYYGVVVSLSEWSWMLTCSTNPYYAFFLLLTMHFSY